MILSEFPGHDFVKGAVSSAEIHAGLGQSRAYKGVTYTPAAIREITNWMKSKSQSNIRSAGDRVLGSDNAQDCWIAAYCLLTGDYSPLLDRFTALAKYGDNQDNSDLYADAWSMAAKMAAFFGAIADGAGPLVISAGRLELLFEFAMDFANSVPWVPEHVIVHSAKLTDEIPAKGQGFNFSCIEPAQRSLFESKDHSQFQAYTEGVSDETAMAMMFNLTPRVIEYNNPDPWALMPYTPLTVLAGRQDWRAVFNRKELWKMLLDSEEDVRDLVNGLYNFEPNTDLLNRMSKGRLIRSPYHALRYVLPGGARIFFGAVESGYFGTKPEASVVVNDERDKTAHIWFPGIYKTGGHERSHTVVDTAAQTIVSTSGDFEHVIKLPAEKYLRSHIVLRRQEGWKSEIPAAPEPKPKPEPKPEPTPEPTPTPEPPARRGGCAFVLLTVAALVTGLATYFMLGGGF